MQYGATKRLAPKPTFEPLLGNSFWGGGVRKAFARYRGHLGPSGLKLQTEFENEFPAQKVENGVDKGQNS